MRVNDNHSSTVTINTGAPQGCVLSPVLFIIYTNDCVAQDPSCSMVKFADDAALVALLKDSEVGYRQDISTLSDWCRDNFLQINVNKTKEVIVDFRTKKNPLLPVYIDDCVVENVSEYKYLGTVIDNKLNWNSNTEQVYKKCLQRLYFLRKLRSFDVDVKILYLFYTCFVQSVLTFGMQCWYGSLSLQNRNKLFKIIHLSSKIVGTILKPLPEIYETKVLSLAHKIISNPDHILHSEYSLLPSGRRYLVPILKTNRAKKSFLPSSISLLNKDSNHQD